jgi:hypothetical protein
MFVKMVGLSTVFGLASIACLMLNWSSRRARMSLSALHHDISSHPPSSREWTTAVLGFLFGLAAIVLAIRHSLGWDA